MSGSLVRTESMGWTRISLTTPFWGERMLCSIFMASTTHHLLADRHAFARSYHDGDDAAGHGRSYDVAPGVEGQAGGIDAAGGRRHDDARRLGAAPPRAGRGVTSEALHLHGNGLAVHRDLNGRRGQVAHLNGIPVEPHPDSESGYRQPRLPVLPEYICWRRRCTRHSLGLSAEDCSCIAMARVTPMAAAISFSELGLSATPSALALPWW